jgi:hypothetical protein
VPSDELEFAPRSDLFTRRSHFIMRPYEHRSPRGAPAPGTVRNVH